MAAIAPAKVPSSSLATPVTGTYPSELRSPAVGTPTYIKREDTANTPITPPSAYLDFLKSMTPTSVRPPNSAASFRQSTTDEKGPTPLSATIRTDVKPEVQKNACSLSAANTSFCPPPLSRFSSSESTASRTSTTTSSTITSCASSNTSYDSVAAIAPSSTNATSTSDSSAKATEATPTSYAPPQSAFTYPLPSPYGMQPLSARTPRSAHLRMQIPPSPRSASGRSPMSAGDRSARSMHSPYSAMSPPSAMVTSAMSPFATSSPKDVWETREGGSGSAKVSVRQVVTRTITYSRTALEPAPKGKRRKVESDKEV